MKARTYRLEYGRALARLVRSVMMLLAMSAAIVWDQLLRRNSAARRAIHLRRLFERLGGAYLKIAHHLATPLQLMQSSYGDELSRAVDATAPFPVQNAIDVIERTTRKPLQETFAQFDPEPVISTATHCTYQAVLATGEKVVAKVRRPGIGELFVADLKVFDWITGVLELFTIFKPGQVKKIREELRDILLEEVDFVREARQQDRFRRSAKKSGKRFFTSPRVYFELSGTDVIVQEFASGMWLGELLAGVEQNNLEVLALAARLNIDIGRVARRLLWLSFWSWDESVFFLADPDPDKIILRKNGRLTFIDFTSTSAIDFTKRRALKQNLYYIGQRDPVNMARASLALLEPLPPVDVMTVANELEAHNWQLLYAFETRGAQRPWYERTTMQQWTGLAQVARRFGIVIDVGVMRLLKATIMHETLAVRLDESISVSKEFEWYTRQRASRATRQALRRVVRHIGGSDNRRFLRYEELAGTGEALLFRIRHALALPKVNFNAMTGKGASVALIVMKFATQVLALLAVAGYITMVVGNAVGPEIMTFRAAVSWVGSRLIFRLAVAVLLLMNTRAMLFRLEDKDV
jgi:ubiquinone biosynthesis protein